MAIARPLPLASQQHGREDFADLAPLAGDVAGSLAEIDAIKAAAKKAAELVGGAGKWLSPDYAAKATRELRRAAEMTATLAKFYDDAAEQAERASR